MMSDDLVLGRIVAQQVAARMDHFHLLQRLKQAVAMEERMFLARELHDGVLQSLAGVGLQLQTLRNMLGSDPQAAQECLGEIQRVIADEQRDLRFFIQELKPASLGPPGGRFGLTARLEGLGKRVESQWGLPVELRTEGLDGRISEDLAYEIHQIVREALVNAAKHARASSVRVELAVQDNHMCITVADDGRGFPFRGRHDHVALTKLKLGPVILRERVAALRGSLGIESTEGGARLEVRLPIGEAEARDGH